MLAGTLSGWITCGQVNTAVRRMKSPAALQFPSFMSFPSFVSFHVSGQMINCARDRGRAESVVDVDDGDAGSTGVEHSEERGDAAEAGAVPDARRDGDDRRLHETADNT